MFLRPSPLCYLLLTMALLVAASPALAGPDPDPFLHTEYDGDLCTINWVCTGTTAEITWPRDGGSCWNDAPASMPLVLILRGYGYDHTDYDYLKDHLARNGMFVAAFDVVSGSENAAGHQAAAGQISDYLESSCFQSTLLNLFPGQGVDLHKTGLVGHSRGGETARWLTTSLAATQEFTVQAVMALAPTRQTNMYIYGTYTNAYLVLYGGGDPDVSPPNTFAAHDLAGWNEVPTPTPWDLDRGMKFIPWGNHSGFGDPAGPLGPTVQQDMTAGYANAFLRTWLRDDWQFYDAYIRGDETPTALSHPVWSQFSSRITRRVIDNFQDLSLSPNTLGGAVVTSGMSSATVIDAAQSAQTPHATRLLKVEPAQNNAYVEWHVPESAAYGAAFSYLSFRIGRLSGSGPINARVLIKNGGSFSTVPLADYGAIPEPAQMCVDGNPAQGCQQWEDQGFFSTIRIPLSDFDAVDDIEVIYIQFLGGAVGDEIMIDNLELADYVFIPI